MATTGNPLKDVNEIPGYQLRAIVAGAQVVKGPLALPATGTSTLFKVSGGAILVTSLVGIVASAMSSTVTSLSIGMAPTVGAAATPGIGGPTLVTSLAAGTMISAPAAAGAAGGALVTPAVPATGVPAVNTYHGSVDVAMAGGVLTGVTVNGVPVGTTPWSPATYTVPAHGNIAWAGSAAPTWTWTGSAALEIAASGGMSVPKDCGFIVPVGNITLTTTATNTGTVKWYMTYVPLDNSPGVGVLAQVS